MTKKAQRASRKQQHEVRSHRILSKASLNPTALAELQDRQTTLIDVVQSLGEYINHGDENIRSKAISYLTAVLSALPHNYLTRQQLQVLCQFFCDRIEDEGAIEGLSKLQSLERFNTNMAQIVVRA